LRRQRKEPVGLRFDLTQLTLLRHTTAR
jgi:hypothetical protein